MRKKTVDLSRSEQGQSLIIVALVFVGLVVLAGLAVDGGNLFVQRRQAQAAADASTLAGTRLISHAIQTCSPIDMPAFDARLHRTINDYAEQNGIGDTNGIAGDEVNDNVVGYYVDNDGNSLGQVGETGALPVGTSGLRVEVADTHETFFMPLIGIQEIPSSAQAMALTGVLKQFGGGGPLLPIAVPQEVVEQIDPGEEWEMFDNLDGKFCYNLDGEEYCIEDTGAPHNAQRGWLNLNHIFNDDFLGSDNQQNRTFIQAIGTSGCPRDPLRPNEYPEGPSDLPGLAGYASGGCPYSLGIIAGTEGYLDGDFIHGTSGATTSAMRAIYEGYAGETVYAPVFDRAFLREEMVDTFAPGAASPDGFPNGGGFSSSGGGSGSAYYYHIVGYTALHVGTDRSNHVLRGEFVELSLAPGAIDPTGYTGTCGIPKLYGITLWE